MGTIFKTSLALILIMLLSSTYADETMSTENWTNDTETITSVSSTWENESENEDKYENHTYWTWVNNMIKVKTEVRKLEKKELEKEMKEQRNEMKMEIEQNRDEIRNNLQNFRKENWTASWAFNNLSTKNKAEIKTLQEKFKDSTETLKKEYESKIKSATWIELKDTLRQELKIKLEELVIAHQTSLEVFVWSNSGSLAWIKARKEIAEQNKELRKNNNEAREEFRGDRKEQVLAYKEKFHSQLGAKLDKVWAKSPEKLENVLDKIDVMMEKFDANTKISEINKEKIMSQLTALKELLEDSLDSEDSITTE